MSMQRLDALRAIYPKLERHVVITIMGAVAAELQSLGHRPNFFYLQHAMGLASSMGLGIALARPERQVRDEARRPGCLHFGDDGRERARAERGVERLGERV